MIASLIQVQGKNVISNIGNLECMSSHLDASCRSFPFRLLNFPKISLCFQPIFCCCGCIKNACGLNMFFKNVCTLNTSAKSAYLLISTNIWALNSGPGTAVSKTDKKKSLPSWSLHSLTYLNVNKNVHSRRIRILFNQKVTLRKQLLKALQKPFLLSNRYSFM